MNYKKIILITLILLSQFSFSQSNGEAYYYKVSNYNLKSIGTNTKSNKSIDSVITEMEFLVKFNDSLAIYEKVNIDNSIDNLTISLSGYNGPFFYDFKNEKAIKKQGKYLIEKDFKDFNWILTGEVLKIDTLICYKAMSTIKVKGRRSEVLKPVTAWYTTEICIPIGPDGFAGLPGVIVELKIDKVITRLRKIDFSEEELIIELPKNNKRMTEREFEIFIEDLINNGNNQNEKN